MNLKDAVVLVTGANRGIGYALARECLRRGAKVYAGARDPATVLLPGAIPVPVDVTIDSQVAEAALACPDVTVLINNAGVAHTGGYFAGETLDQMRWHYETNVLGVLRMTRAFAPGLAAHQGGAIVNILSVASFVNSPMLGSYGVSKAAAWALTNGLRLELREQGTQVLGMHVGFVDTELVAKLDVPKSSPETVAKTTLDALEAGASEVLCDDYTRWVHGGLTADPAVYLAPIKRPVFPAAI